MSIYGIILFLHIVGALGLFAGIALEQVSLARLREVGMTNQARDWLGVLSNLRRIDAPSGLLILATGLYMVAKAWSHQAWTGVAIIGMVLMAAISVAVTSRRVRAAKDAVGPSDAVISTGLRERLSDPVMRMAATLRAAIGVGIVFDMAVKPAAPGALAAIGVALAVGALVAFAQWSGRREAVSGTRVAGRELR